MDCQLLIVGPESHTVSKTSMIPECASQCNGSSKKLVNNDEGPKMSYYRCVDERYPLSTLTLPQLFEQQAKLNTGAGITWHRPSERITYTELYEKGMELAKGLLAIGLRRGDSVLSIGVEGADGLILFVAASAIGVKFSAPYVYSPIKNNIAWFTQKFNPKLVLLGHTVTGLEMEDPFEGSLHCLEELAHSPEFELPMVYRDKYSDDMEVSGITDNRLRKVAPLEDLYKLGSSVSDEELEKHKSAVSLNEPCFFTFSSGSTGDPKTILIGAAMLTNSGIRREERFMSSRESRHAVSSLCTEDLSVVEEVAAGAHTGNDVFIIPQCSTWDCDEVCREILEMFEKHRVTFAYADQYFLTYIVNHPEITKDYDISCWKAIMLSGSGSSPSYKELVLNLFPDSVDAYGLSENYYATSTIPGRMKEKLNTVGKAVVNQEAKVVDTNGDCLPVNCEGELWLRGYCNFLEYRYQPELTKSVLTEEGWFKTGDCAAMDEEGDIRIIGRLSTAERFKVNTDVVYAQSIERTMMKCEHIKEIAVIGRDTGTPVGHEISYCVILHEKDSLTMQEVYEYAKKLVENSNEWPMRIFFYDKFPLQGYRHKVGRKALIKEISEKVEKDPKINITEEFFETF